MKKIPVEDAVGMKLCHDVTEMRKGFKGPVFKRGHVIEEKDIDKLLDIGKKTVFVWEENAGEIHEEDAALRMADMSLAKHMRKEGPSEGKILFFAEEDGLFRVDVSLLNEINSIEDVTMCCLPDRYPVKKGSKIASMRIVPLVTKEEHIVQAESLCREKKLFELVTYKRKKAGIVITGSEVYSGRIKDMFEPVVRKKLAEYPCDIGGVTICDDDEEMILNAARKHLDADCDFLIFTGGMSVDPDDITPTAARKLGADIITHGVPAQPGNMTLVAYLGEVPILGIPGAAISLPVTIFDVLLPAIFANEKITKKDLIRLGDGGLCQSCKECRWPNCTFGRY